MATDEVKRAFLLCRGTGLKRSLFWIWLIGGDIPKLPSAPAAWPIKSPESGLGLSFVLSTHVS